MTVTIAWPSPSSLRVPVRGATGNLVVSTVSGTNVTIEPIAMPAFFVQTEAALNADRARRVCVTDVVGTPASFEVEGQPFVLWTASGPTMSHSASPTAACGMGSQTSALSFEQPGSEAVTTSFGSLKEMVGGESVTAFLIRDWPNSGSSFYVAEDLASNASYVTYRDTANNVKLFERPVDGVCALIVPSLYAEGTPDRTIGAMDAPTLGLYTASEDLIGSASLRKR